MKKLFNIFSLIALFIFIGYLVTLATKPENDGVLIHFLDVGQGDATYIEISDSQDVLIDGGPIGDTDKSIEKFRPFYDREIKHLVITHPHLDHFGGLIDITREYKIGCIYMTKMENESDEYRELIAVIGSKKIPVRYVKKGDEIVFDREIKLRFLLPETTSYRPANINNASIVTELVWGNKKALFMGDLEAEEQSKIRPEKVDILKVAHHCSNDAFATDFFSKVLPTYSIISVGKSNSFGHPAQSCLNTIRSSQIFRTDLDGDINFEMTAEDVRPVSD